MFYAKYALIFLIIQITLLICNADRTKDRMYIGIKTYSSCFRRLNATHQVGCSSQRGGAKGVVHFVTNYEDLSLIQNGTGGPYIPVVPIDFLTYKNVKYFEENPKISGLVLYYNNESLGGSFTHDLQCPNENFGLQNTCSVNDNNVWNPKGTGLLFENINLPLFYIENSTEIDVIKSCFQKFNNFSYETHKDRSLCSLQLNSFMYAAKNTPTCVRRSNIAANLNPIRVCDPLGDKNIWASLFPLAEYNEKTQEVKPILGQKYIVIAARTDTVTMFEKTTGADSPITGIVTVLAIAKILKQILPKNENYSTNVLFIFFNGESFDYLGSQRILYDMENGNFPIETESGSNIFPVIKPENISLFIELSQLSRNYGRLFVHLYKVNQQNTYFTELLKKNIAQSAPISLEVLNGSIPPSSSQTFLKKYENLPTVVLTNHKNAYVNQYYNSIFDNSSNINYKYFNKSKNVITEDSVQKHLLSIANMVAKSIYEEITGKLYPTDNMGEDLLELVDEILHCYLENQNCKIYQAVGKQPQKIPDNQPLNLYVGIDGNPSDATTFLGFILGWFIGDIVGESTPNCTNISKNYAFRFYNMSISINDLNTTKCFRMVMNFTEAVSPAFIIDDYDWSSNLYSSWTESTWADINIRLFLKPSEAYKSLVLAVGSISFIFSFIFVYFIKSRSHLLFTPESTQPSPVNC